MTDAPKIREIDLMAYADGLLEGDAARKAAVEAHLAANQADAERVRAIMRDNAAIRALYAAELERPTPAHFLRAAREPRRRKRYFSPEAIAAGLALAFLAAGGGWLVGQRGGETAALPQAYLQALAQQHAEPDAQPAMSAALGQNLHGALLSAATNSGWIEIPLPDLSAHGFDLIERERVVIGDEDMIRLAYRSSEETLNLLLRVRPQGGSGKLRSTGMDDLALVNWSSGPISYALTSEAPLRRARQMAEMVRGTVGAARFVDPAPATVPEPGESVAGDGLLGAPQPAESFPAPLQPSQLN
ncbi:hypothetical protein [Chelativorans sp. M5D2P16]|uniref:anti-sigma factor family protein n=1 Tax=Chelativorans sp. M5D2P16 TaxID=3095678 RepID=UPI002ACABA71|nr:hypothetical protein [Chelativorans sp. M5D2P16]MDZ5696900.1 hypothetical protein [Chelativorans sp. M5D2P16]